MPTRAGPYADKKREGKLDMHRILIGSADKAICRKLEATLPGSSYAGTFPGSFDVRCAGDGVRLVAETRRQCPSAILVDLDLPAGGGWSMVERLRNFPDLAAVPIVIMGLREARISAESVFSAGADAFLPKPLDCHALVPVLAHLLSRSRSAAVSIPRTSPAPSSLVPSLFAGSHRSVVGQGDRLPPL